MSTADNAVSMDTSEMNVIFVHSAIDDYPLTCEEFRVYSHIARRAGLGEAWPKVESVAKKCRIHTDTARRCLHNLIEYGLIAATERKGKTTLYRITRPSLWKRPETALAIQQAQATATKAKRAEKKAAREAAEPNPSLQTQGVNAPPSKHEASETKGGHPSGLKGGHPSETKGAEVTPPEGVPSEGAPFKTPSTADAAGGGNTETGISVTEQINPNTSEPASPVQVQASSPANAEQTTATDLENVPAAAGGAARVPTEHQAMMDAIRAALYPSLPRCADAIEKRIAAVSKELRGAGLGAEAPAGILAYIRSEQSWRRVVTPETLVQVSADWASARQPAPATAAAARPTAAPLDDDGEIDMAALMASAPLNGRRNR